MRTRTLVAGMIALPLNAVLFGVGVTTVLSIPALEPWRQLILPAVIITALVVTIPLSWMLAPRLRVRSAYYPRLFRKPRNSTSKGNSGASGA